MPSKRPVIMTYTDEETREKFKIVSGRNCRSMSQHLEYLVKREIHEYEQEHGGIELPKADEPLRSQ